MTGYLTALALLVILHPILAIVLGRMEESATRDTRRVKRRRNALAAKPSRVYRR